MAFGVVVISSNSEIIDGMPPHSNNRVGIATHAKLFRGLGDAARLGLLWELRSDARTAGELAHACGLSPSNASNHLRCLLECGLVDVVPQGRHNVYRLRTPEIAVLLEASARIVHSTAGSLIERCRNYGTVSRRALRNPAPASAGRTQKGSRARPVKRRPTGHRRAM